MAITVVGVCEGSATNGNDPTVTLPVGTAAGDLVVAFGGHPRFSAGIAGVSTSGYTEGTAWGSGSTPDRIANYAYKFMVGTPDTDFVGRGSANAADGVSYVGVVLRGADPTTPLDIAVVTSNGASSGAPNSPSVDTVTNGAVVITCGLSRANDTTVTAPTGYGNQVDRNSNDDSDITAMLATKEVVTAGTEDPGVWDVASDGHCSCTIVIRPAAAGGVVLPKLALLGVGI